MEGEDFLVFVNVRAMIQFNNHAETVCLRSASDKNQISNVERQTLQQFGRAPGSMHDIHACLSSVSRPFGRIVEHARYCTSRFSYRLIALRIFHAAWGRQACPPDLLDRMDGGDDGLQTLRLIVVGMVRL